MRDFSDAILIDPEDANAYYNRGLAYASLDQNELAIADFTVAVQLDPMHGGAYNNMGLVQFKTGNLLPRWRISQTRSVCGGFALVYAPGKGTGST
ncbi:MAG: tetratricopeptide repeat protein [Eubacteriales bacterium]